MSASGGGREIVSLDRVTDCSAMRDCCRRPVPIAEVSDETARARVGGEGSVSKGGGLVSNDR